MEEKIRQAFVEKTEITFLDSLSVLIENCIDNFDEEKLKRLVRITAMAAVRGAAVIKSLQSRGSEATN